MTGSRHWFVLEPLTIPSPFDSLLEKATNFELVGNWYLAGETYIELQNLPNAAPTSVIKAKLLARAASCFELAHDSRISARFYDQAAQEVASSNSNPHLAAELFNRAALQYREASEFFFCWIGMG
jgi:hypothetical protein